MLQHAKSLTDGMIIYSVVIGNYEKLDFRNDALAGVRANYFNSNLACQRETTEIVLDKIRYNLAYDLRKDKPISWKITKDGRPYQSVKKETGGVYTVFYYADNGIIFKRQYFNAEHIWIRTEYYDTESFGRMVCRVEPYSIEGVVALKLNIYEVDGSRTEKTLFPSKSRNDVECTALVYSNMGMLWYDESFSPEISVENEAVEQHNGFTIDTDRFALDFEAEERLDLEGADYLEVEEADEAIEEVAEPESEIKEYSAYDKIEDILREAHKTNKTLFGEVLSHTDDSDLAEDNSTEENTEAETAEDNSTEENTETAEDNSIEENTEAETAEDNSVEENTEAETVEDNSAEENTEAETAEDNSSEENTEVETAEENSIEENTGAETAEDNSTEKNTEAEAVEDNSTEENTEAETVEDNSTEENIEIEISESYSISEEPECKSVIANNGGEYRYYGELDEQGRRTGIGRTVSPNGTTSYDGFYKEDKREGFGVCYYKSGEINYVGSWSDNSRSGSGVGYRQSDGTMHAGRWNNNAPDGCGARFDSDGGFIEAGFFENGVRNGVSVTFDENQNVIISRWKDGEKISEQIVSVEE